MEPTGGGTLGRLSGAHSGLCLSGHFSHVETEAQVGAEPGVRARECALPGPGSWGSGGAPEGPPEGAWTQVCTVFVGAEPHSSAVSRSSR